MDTAATNAGWVVARISNLLTSFGVVGLGLLVILALSAWLNIGILGVSTLLIFVGLIVGTIGYRLQHGIWIPKF
jgi:hypothetical protein